MEYLPAGIDIGTTTVKLVMPDDGDRILYNTDAYREHEQKTKKKATEKSVALFT